MSQDNSSDISDRIGRLTPRYFLYFILCILVFTSEVFSQAGTYYNSINTNSSNFINDLKSRIRSPYNRVSYDQYDETIVANFESVNNGNGTRSLFCVYSGYEFVYTGVFAWGTMSREHTWAHSWMPTFPSTQNDQYSDQHMIFPTHQNNANARRSTHPFGYVVNATYQFIDGKVGTDSSGNTVYEPRDEFKGDLARALLYAVIRYDNVSGDSWSFNWLNGTKLPSLGEDAQSLALLLQWHLLDPPDRREIERCDYVNSIQLNRNPFADRPEYASYIDFNNVTKINPSYAAEPTSHAGNLASSNQGNSVTVNWNDAVGSILPDNYLLLAYDTENYFVPIDGSEYQEDNDLTDGYACIYQSYAGANSLQFNGLQNNKRYYFTMYSVKGSGSVSNYKIDGTVPQTNVLVNPSLSIEPSNHVTGFSVTGVTTTTLQLSWTDAVPGSQAPSAYLILANTNNTFSAPLDGIQVADDLVLSDGNAAVNVAYSGANSYSFTGLLSGVNYYFRMYPYNGSGTQVNYKTDGLIPSAAGMTQAVQSVPVAVLTDDFNRSDNSVLGNSSFDNIQWQESESSAPSSISVRENLLRMGSTNTGRDLAFLDLSQSPGYVNLYSSADTTLVWAFNMRQSRSDPSGHDNNNYGIAYILGKNTTDLSTGSGYAVVLGQSGSADAIRLTKFTGGVIGNSRFTNIISGGDYAREYLSIKVTYDPSSGLWSLFVDSSLTDFPHTDPRNSSTQVGSAVDNSYTSLTMNYTGALWNHVTSANDSAVFDDIYISDLSLKSTISVIPEGLLNEITGRLNISDSVRVYLRNSNAPYQVVDSAASDIDSINFTGYFRFAVKVSGSYYLSVTHRNSIESWSSVPVLLAHGTVANYDFTGSQSSTYGNNSVLKSGKFCIYTGDVNQDGTVDGFDLSVIDNDAYSFLSGYISSDLNGDGFADASDASLADNNAFNFISRVTP